MKFQQTAVLLALAFLLSYSATSNASGELPAKTFEGLELVSDSGFAAVYIEPGFNLSQYNRIFLDDAYIAFKKDWQRNQDPSLEKRVSDGDMDKIRIELMLLFREVFSRTLLENGYELTTDISGDVLQIKPAIINLGIVSTVDNSGSKVITYAENAAEMTLYLELYDSLSGDIIAKAVDRKQDSHTGYFKWENRVSNRAAASRIVQVWANTLKEGLDKARAVN